MSFELDCVKHEIFGGTYADLPTASPASTVTQGMTAAASAITPTQAATTSPVATASAVISLSRLSSCPR